MKISKGMRFEDLNRKRLCRNCGSEIITGEDQEYCSLLCEKEYLAWTKVQLNKIQKKKEK